MPTLPQRPRDPKRDMYPSGEGWYKGFAAFMLCSLILFVAVLTLMCIKLG